MDKWKVGSAGTWIISSNPIDEKMVIAAAELNILVANHQPIQISQDLLEEYDMIIVMENGQKEAISYEFPSVNYKIFLLTDFNGPAYNIPDPIGMSISFYRKILSDINEILCVNFNSICNTARKLSNDSIRN